MANRQVRAHTYFGLSLIAEKPMIFVDISLCLLACYVSHKHMINIASLVIDDERNHLGTDVWHE